jgi:hypothetical protein
MPSYVFLLDTDGDKIIDEMVNAGAESLDLTGQAISGALEIIAHEDKWLILDKHQVPPHYQSAVNERIAAAGSDNVTQLSLVHF